VLGMYASAAAGPRMVEQEMVEVRGAVKYRMGAYADELDNRPEYHHTDSDLRETHPGPGKQGKLVLGDLAGWQAFFGRRDSQSLPWTCALD
jgi:hypothetical protein